MSAHLGAINKEAVSATQFINIEWNRLVNDTITTNRHHCNIISGVVEDFASFISLFSDEACYVLVEGRPYFEGVNIHHSKIAELIARRYKASGDALFSELKGPFSLVLFLKLQNKIILSVDKMGIRPLFYCDTGGFVAYSSRLEWLKQHPGINAEVDVQSIYRYLYFNMIPSPYSLIKNVQKVEPGEKVTITAGGIDKKYYWSPNFKEQKADVSSLKKSTFNALKGAVSAQKTEKCASFLSGGLDSSTVTGLFQQISDKQVPAYTVGFDADGYDEMAYARIAAKHYGVEHREYYLTPNDVLDALPKIAAAYDEPFGNSSAVPTYCCAKVAAADGITTLLAGDGGDELFAGNERYVKQRVFEKYFNIPGFFRKGVLEPIINFLPNGGGGNIISKGQSYIRQANTPLPDRLQTYNVFHQNSPDSILSYPFMMEIMETEPLEILRKRYQYPADASMLNKMMWLDWKQTLADNDLRKVNVMCELAGIDVRYPMLHDQVIDISLQIPSDIKVADGKLRDFYKKTFDNFLPNEIINKPKQGFGLPFGVWMKDHPGLNEYTYGAISDFRKRNIIGQQYIDDLLEKHKNVHPAYYGEQIWVFMMLEIWLQQHKIDLSF